MRRRGRPLRLVAALALSAALATGCGARGKDQDSVVQRRLEGEPNTLNALLTTTDPENVVLALLSRNLLDYDASLNLVPGLAEAVDASADHLSYTIRLRPDARWEDGSPVTSEDVSFTLETLMDPKVPAQARRPYFDGFEKVERIDPRTARVTFRAPYAGRPDAFNLALLPAAAYRGTDVTTNPRNRNPLANGPYRLAKWESGRLELVRNTQYFGEKPEAERVVFRVVPENAAAFQALLTGEIDEMRVNFEQKKKLDAGTEKARAVVFEELTYSYIGWNNRLPQFSDARVRRALTMLVDREAIARALYGGLARPANGPVPPVFWFHDPALKPWPHDPNAAGVLLDEAGFRKGADGWRRRGSDRLAFTLSLGAGSEVQRQIVESAQQSFRAAGIEMTIRPMEWSAFASKADAGDFEACALALNMDPSPDLSIYWHSSQVPPNGLNTVFYRNPKVDAVLEKLRTTFDREEARSLYQQLQKLLHEDEPVTFLHTAATKWGVSRRFAGVKASAMGLFLFWPGAAGWRTGPSPAP